ncbi:MAG: nitroreductase family deazaflavin-dependent oxidoreductase [Chloroflexi bacterium]|nr:nitroreductase family deazaflavin-dependent oxidoreductase [Chloroflexota bacterium]
MSNEAGPITIAYPSGWLLKQAFKVPIPLWRMGLGFLVGKLFMILTTTGRKSGQPRHTAIEFREYKGRKYVYCAFGEKADWYKNILTDPRVTIQTASGTEHVIARRITDEGELVEAFEFVAHNPTMRRWVQALGFRLNRDEFIAQKERFYLVTFDLTDESTPSTLEADLKWIWLVVIVLISILIGWLSIRQG